MHANKTLFIWHLWEVNFICGTTFCPLAYCVCLETWLDRKPHQFLTGMWWKIRHTLSQLIWLKEMHSISVIKWKYELFSPTWDHRHGATGSQFKTVCLPWKQAIVAQHTTCGNMHKAQGESSSHVELFSTKRGRVFFWGCTEQSRGIVQVPGKWEAYQWALSGCTWWWVSSRAGWFPSWF